MNDLNPLSPAANYVFGLPFGRRVRAATLTAMLLGLAACGGGGGGGGGGISTGDANDLMENISAKVGGVDLQLQPGDLPVSTPVEAAPKAIAGVTSVSAEPGDTVNIPISVQSSAVLQSLCAKIGNATSTLCASLSSSASSLSEATPNQKRIARSVQAKQLPSQFSEVLNLSITLPDELNPDGTFCVTLNVEDVEDLVSNNVQVCITAVANITEPDPAENDQPNANALPAVLADGEWISNCVDLPSGGNAESSKLGFRFGLSNSYEEFIELWSSSNSCSGTPDNVLQHVVQGSYASGTAEFNRQLQKWQLPFDFIPQQNSEFAFGTCFNVLRVAGQQLFLGIPLAAVVPGQTDLPGSCVSAAGRPESISLAFPFANRASTEPPDNVPPVANAGNDFGVAASAGQTLVLDGRGSADEDGIIVSYSWVQITGPTVSLQSADSAQPNFAALTPPASLTFQLTVTDDAGAEDTDTVVVTLMEPANLPPVAEAGSNVADLVGGESYFLDGTGSDDPDGSIVTYVWEQSSGPSVSLQNANTATPNLILPTGPATLTFRLTVTDDDGATDIDEVSLMIMATSPPANLPPNAVALPGQNTSSQNVVPSGTRLFLSAAQSSDPDGQIVSYLWQRTAGVSVQIDNATSAIASFIVPDGQGSLTFRVTVQDDDGASDAAAVVLSYSTSPNTPNPGLTFTTTWNTGAELDLFVTDPFGGVISWNTSTSDFGDIENPTLPMGPEIITFPSPPPGDYCYELDYYDDGGNDAGPTNYNLVITLGNQTVGALNGALTFGQTVSLGCYDVGSP